MKASSQLVFAAVLCLVPIGCDSLKPIEPVEEAQIQVAKHGGKPPGERNYRIGAGDTIGIEVYRRSDLQAVLKLPKISVAADGTAVLPMTGPVDLTGLTVAEASNKIRSAFAGHMIEPEVSVTVVDARGRRFFVMGEVKVPGVFTAPNNVDVIEAVLMAGGFTKDADKEEIVILRRDPNRRVKSDVEDLLENAEFVYNLKLQPLDIVYVPPNGIAKTERFTQHVAKVMQPFLEVASVVILSSAINN
ncbi:MAG: polysaccharide export outer membrane protein [Verrucomicrobiales bacterium]